MEEPTRETDYEQRAEEYRHSTTGYGQTLQLKKRHIIRNILLALLVLLLVAGSATGAYWWRGKEASKVEKRKDDELSVLRKSNLALQKELKAVKAEADGTKSDKDGTVCVDGKTPSAATIKNVEASISSGNTAALEGYMAESVNVVLAASDGLGARTATEAVGDVTANIGNPTTSTWDFTLSAATLSSYADGDYGKYFTGDSIIGKSSTDRIISFTFDCNAKIDTVFISNSENLVK